MLTLAADNWMLSAATLIPTLPFVSMLICGLLCLSGSERTRRAAAWVTVAAIAGAFVCSVLVSMGLSQHLLGEPPGTHHAIVPYFQWINIGSFAADFSFYIDSLTTVMLFVVTGIGALIAIYAAGYMAGDPGYPRFFAYISLFIFAMTCLVMADNLLLLYLGWEGVGAASYLLIGYYYRKPSAVAAAKKAFIVNRIGDFGFALGLMGVFLVFGTIQFADFLPAAEKVGELAAHAGAITETVAEQAQDAGHTRYESASLLFWIPFLLMLGAFGKSAQFPLHVWLPDAMEGPTPVSALIHAATMVTAGVYMIARLITLFAIDPGHHALTFVAATGALTALLAATIALCQYDLKRIWAYSTVSQLGFMFLGVGVLGTTGAVFHLFTHAFFKALLFLTAGSVMHALVGQLDLRKMSGLFWKMPVTAVLMAVGCVALAGVPFTSGFFSKDMILTDALAANWLLGSIGIVTALLTAFYTARLWFRVFTGPQRYELGDEHHGYSPTQHPWIAKEDAQLAHAHHGEEHGHSDHGHDDHAHDEHHHHGPHEMPWSMNAPLIVLAVGALAAGFVFGPMTDWMSDKIDHSTAAVAHHGDHAYHEKLHVIVSFVSGGGAILMILLAAFFHWARRDITEKIAARTRGVIRVLYNKYWIDELYDLTIRQPLRVLGFVCFYLFDRFLIDGGLIDGAGGKGPRLLGKLMRPTLRGSLQGYGLAMGLGLVAVLVVLAWTLDLLWGGGGAP